MAADEHPREVDDLIAASSLGAEGMTELCARTPDDRLAAIRRTTAVRDAVDDLAAALDHTSPLARIQARDALQDLARALNGASNGASGARARAIDPALDRSDLAHALDLTRDLTRPLTRARALTRAIGDALDHALAESFRDDQSHISVAIHRASGVLTKTGGHDCRLSSASNRVLRLLPDVLTDEAARQRVVDVVCRARDDFLNADLTQVDLTGIWLEGVQWTPAATRWPAEWEDQIQQDSVEIALGIYQIRGGNLREKALV